MIRQYLIATVVAAIVATTVGTIATKAMANIAHTLLEVEERPQNPRY